MIVLYAVAGVICLSCADLDASDDPAEPVLVTRSGCPKGDVTPGRLRVGIGGFWGSEDSVSAYNLVAGFLSSRLGMKVETISTEKYDELVDRIASGEVDAAKIPPLAYVKAVKRLPCLRLLRTMVADGAVRYSGYVIVRRDSPLTSLGQLAGKKIAFVERSSASGYLFALVRLADAGLKPGRDFENAVFLGTHEAVIRAVLSGEVDAGATFQGALKAARLDEMDTGSLRVLGVTGRIPMDAFVVRPDLAPGFVWRLEDALDALNSSTPEGRKALSGLKYVNGWVPGDDAFYDPVRRTLEEVEAMGGEAP